jgi:hypothetical protein
MKTGRMLGNLMKILLFTPFFFGCLGLFAQQQEKGSLLLAKIEGSVNFYEPDGKRMEANSFKEGDALPLKYFAETEEGSTLLALLSNGTLVTLRENTRMKVGEFSQSPFEQKNIKMADLQEEPSESQVTIDLDFGSLVVKTKKLNWRSNLNIHSPVGVAGIRGTEFQMAMSPNSGVDLDVTESVVAFTPPGAPQAIPVSEGKGLSVSPNGVAVPRPINPVVAQEITTINQTAVEATESVSLDTVESSGSAESEEGNQDSEESGEDSDASDSEDSGEKDGGESDDGMGNQEDSGAGSSSVNDVLENNSDLQQVRKSGKLSENSKAMSKFGLSVDQTDRFHSLSDSAQSNLLLEDRGVVHRVLSMDGFLKEEADIFFGYGASTRIQILGLEDPTMIALLRERVDEDLLVESLMALNLNLSVSELVPDTVESGDIDQRASQLSDRLREGGNEEVMEDLLERGGGVLTDDLLREGEVADSILRDYELGVTDPASSLSLTEVLSNPFYEELSALYRELELDGLVGGLGSVYAGRNLIVSENAAALVPYFGEGVTTLVISASQDLELESNFDLTDLLPEGSTFLVMAGGNLNARPGIEVNLLSQNLVVATRQDLAINDVALHAKDEVSVRGVRDVTINKLKIGADSLVTLKARRDLNVDGLSFSRDVSRIVMEASTLRLKNINFPAASAVQLNSLKGPIDGRYPNFGISVPAVEQIGRVNFIQNISVGGNAVMNRQAFDQHGASIQIGKILRP